MPEDPVRLIGGILTDGILSKLVVEQEDHRIEKIEVVGVDLESVVSQLEDDFVGVTGSTMTGPLVLPSGNFSEPGLQVGTAGVYQMADGHLAFVTPSGLIFHTSETAGTGLRRDVGNPATLGGRIYIEDELFVEDDLWADEGVQVTSANVPVLSTTLTVDAEIGDKIITVASVPAAWAVDKTIHFINTPGSLYDRPRIRSIDGTSIELESGLRFSYSSGTVVSDNPWRGAIYPTASWPTPSGIMSVGADLTAEEADAGVPQVVLLNKEHCRYRLGLSKLFSSDWIVEGGLTTALGGFDLSVSAAVFAKDSDVCQSSVQTLTVSTPHATLPRVDIVVINSSGVASVISGVPNAIPVVPATPADSLKVAEVSVSAAAVEIDSGDISFTLANPMRLRVVDVANGGYVFGPQDDTGVRIRVYDGALRIVEGLQDGVFDSLDLNPSGGEVTTGAGGLAVGGPFGANGEPASGKITLGAAANDPASTQTLVNNIRQALIDFGLGQT
jgi:hypothetical protein